MYLELLYYVSISFAFKGSVLYRQDISFFVLVSANFFFVDFLPALLMTVAVQIWLHFLEPAWVDGASSTDIEIENGLCVILATIVSLLVTFLGFGGMINERQAAQKDDKLTLLQHTQDGLIILDNTLKEVKFFTQNAEKFTGGNEARNLERLRFSPLSVSKQALLGRTEESTGLIKTISVTDQRQSLTFAQIIAQGRESSTVYQVELDKLPDPNQVVILPEPKMYCCLKVVDVVHFGEPCKAVYFQCMRHPIDAMHFQSAYREEKSRLELRDSSAVTMSHELHDTLASSIMLLSKVLSSTTHKETKMFLSIVHSQLHFTLSFINDINDLKMLYIGRFDPKI